MALIQFHAAFMCREIHCHSRKAWACGAKGECQKMTSRRTLNMSMSRTARLMLGSIGAIFACAMAAGLAAIKFAYPFEQPGPFAAGLLAGCLLSAAKVLLLEKSLAQAVERESGAKAKNYASAQALLRYVGTILVLGCAVLLPRVFGVFGIIAGVLSLQLSAYIASALLKRESGGVNGKSANSPTAPADSPNGDHQS
jgi:hypothetical protein